MLSMNDVRPVWAEIDLDALAHNIGEVRRVTKDDTLVTAVIKADGYGHGAVEIAETFLENGADRIAVATLSEAIELRKNDLSAPLMILGYTPNYQSEIVVVHDIIQTVYSYEQAEALSHAALKLNKDVKIHIKLDTGMSRLGYLCCDNYIEDINKMKKLPNLCIEGIFTHFAKADYFEKETTLLQKSRFDKMLSNIQKNFEIPIKHVSNSAAIIDCPNYNMDMVRAGIMIYGLYPSDEVDKTKVDLKTAMTLKARVSRVRDIKAGEGISYGHKYKATDTIRVATIPIGYADGFTRMLSHKIKVSIEGVKVDVIGTICMDQCMLDVTGLDVKPGDEVVIFGNGQNGTNHIDDVARMLGTINYEIVCMVGKRVPRIYIKNGEIVKKRDYLLRNWE